MTSISAYSMHRAIKFAGCCTLPIVGIIDAYDRYQTLQIPADGKPVQGAVKKWSKPIMKECGVEKIPFQYGDNMGWCTVQDKMVRAAPNTIDTLSRIFAKKPQDRTAAENKEVATNAALAKHELFHVIHKDTMNQVYADFWIPATVQAVSSITRYSLATVYKMQTPKTASQHIAMSCLTIAGLHCKLIASDRSKIIYARHLETQADEFACKHSNRQELEAFAQDFKQHEQTILNSRKYRAIKHDPSLVKWTFFFSNDPHPYSGDRAAMVEKYLKD